MKTITDQISNTFRNIESDLGTTSLLSLTLDVILKSTQDFKGTKVEDFFEQFRQLMIIIKSTKPRIGIIINYLCEIWDSLEQKKDSIKTITDARKLLTEIITSQKEQNEHDIEKLVKIGAECIKENDSILIHSHSRVVLRIIEKAYKQKKKFRLIVAEQEEEKTNDIINFLQHLKIPFFVVPEFMLSHIEKEVTKVFLGAVTLNNNYNFVTDAGTNSVVSEFHHEHIPIYIFIVTRKFALWDAGEQHQTYKVMQKKTWQKAKKQMTYERIKFSHDRIPLANIDHIVTETALLSPNQAIELYDKHYAARHKWRKKHFDLI